MTRSRLNGRSPHAPALSVTPSDHELTILAVVLLVVGLALLDIRRNGTDSVTEGITGKFTVQTTLYLMGGGLLGDPSE